MPPTSYEGAASRSKESVHVARLKLTQAAHQTTVAALIEADKGCQDVDLCFAVEQLNK